MGEADEKRLLGFWGPGPGMGSPLLQLLGDIAVTVDLAGLYYPRDPCLAISNRPLTRVYSPKMTSGADESRSDAGRGGGFR